MKMNNFLSSILIVAAVLSTACSKDNTPQNNIPQETSRRVLNITAINDSKSQVVTVALDSMEKKTFSIGCHVAATTIFDAKNKIFGYMGCDSAYHIINIESGVEVKQIPLPTYLNFVVVDTMRNVLIGHYYIYNGENNGTDHVLTVNLNDGRIISDKQFYVSGLWNATTYFFRDVENEYALLSADKVLVFINSYTGTVVRELNVETAMINNGVYDRKHNRLIGAYSGDDNVIHIITVDLSTGKTLSKVVAQGLNGYRFFESAYDVETNSYVLISSDNEVLFFDVATGKLNDNYQFDFNLTSLKLWYNNK